MCLGARRHHLTLHHGLAGKRCDDHKPRVGVEFSMAKSPSEGLELCNADGVSEEPASLVAHASGNSRENPNRTKLASRLESNANSTGVHSRYRRP